MLLNVTVASVGLGEESASFGINFDLTPVKGPLKHKSLSGSTSMGGDSSFKVKNEFKLQSVEFAKNSISNLKAYPDNISIGSVEVVNNVGEQIYVKITDVTVYSNQSDTYYYHSDEIKTYIFDETSEFVNGGLIDYVDDGSEHTFKLYLIYSMDLDSIDVILVNGVMDSSLLPQGYKYFAYVQDITIPEHTVYRLYVKDLPWTQPVPTSNTYYGKITAGSYYSSYYPYYALNTSSSWVHANSSDGQYWWKWKLPVKLKITNISSRYSTYSSSYRFTGCRWYADDKKTKVMVDSYDQTTSTQSFAVDNVITDTIYFYATGYTGGALSGLYNLKITATEVQAIWATQEFAYTLNEQTSDEPLSFVTADLITSTDVFYPRTKLLFVPYGQYTYMKGDEEITGQGCLVDYVDDGSSVTLNAFIVKLADNSVKVLLSPNDVVSIEDMVEYECVGSIDIPEHFVFGYDADNGWATQQMQYFITKPENSPLEFEVTRFITGE
jgi:Fe-S cluster assembly iron-binding protein IscA